MTSVERLKFLADKADECWLGLSNVEAIKDVLKELEISKKETQQVLDDYQDLGKEYHKLECELEKKDKVIDEMAEYIDNITFVDEKGDYGCDFELLTKTSCKYNGNCKDCIKEHFYKKVEGEEYGI